MVALRQNQGSQNQVEKRAEFSVLTYLSGKKKYYLVLIWTLLSKKQIMITIFQMKKQLRFLMTPTLIRFNIPLHLRLNNYILFLSASFLSNVKSISYNFCSRRCKYSSKVYDSWIDVQCVEKMTKQINRTEHSTSDIITININKVSFTD